MGLDRDGLLVTIFIVENNEKEINVMERFIRKPELLKLLGVSYPTIWRMMKDEEFPKPYKITKRSIGWLSSEVEAWIESTKCQNT